MNILAFAASNSAHSINRKLVEAAADEFTRIAGEGAKIEFLDLNDYEMPIYSKEREAAGGVPEKARTLFEKIGAADGLMISFAEHNGTYSASYKNVFDWMSRIDMKVFQGRPMLAMAASPGGNGGGNVLRTITEAAPHFGSEVVASFSLPRFAENFDWDAGRFKNEDMAAALASRVTEFRAAL